MSSIENLKKELMSLANPVQAKILARFFKTSPGEYGEGDVFLGIKVPVQRQVAKKYIGLDLQDLQVLIDSEIHEYRMTCLLILVLKYKQGSLGERKKYYDFYIKNAKRINNWDLVDVTCPHIVGAYLLDKPRDILYRMAKSKNLWEKRIAMISTFAFIREKDFKDTIKIAKILLRDEHDLIHKAVGWSLREVGKKDEKLLLEFLDKNTLKMPRTMLRYAIEKLPEKKRQFYLNKK